MLFKQLPTQPLGRLRVDRIGDIVHQVLGLERIYGGLAVDPVTPRVAVDDKVLAPADPASTGRDIVGGMTPIGQVDHCLTAVYLFQQCR